MFPSESLSEHDLESSTTPEGSRQMALVSELKKLGCVLGASPDGVIQHGDGSEEVLEVRVCVCVFGVSVSTCLCVVCVCAVVWFGVVVVAMWCGGGGSGAVVL